MTPHTFLPADLAYVKESLELLQLAEKCKDLGLITLQEFSAIVHTTIKNMSPILKVWVEKAEKGE